MSLKFNEFDKNDNLLTKLTVNSEIGSDIPHLAGYTKLSSTTSITLLKVVNHQFILSWCVVLVYLILHVLYSNYDSDCSKVMFFKSSLQSPSFWRCSQNLKG